VALNSENNNIAVSFHAAMRMHEMNLDTAEISRAIEDPEVEYPGKPNRGRATRVAVRGRLAVVHSLDGVVITVLWHRAEARFAA
jgi:hypothetical protein